MKVQPKHQDWMAVILTKYAKNPLLVLTYDIRFSFIRKQVLI